MLEEQKPKHWAERNKKMYCYCCDRKTIWNYVLGYVRYNGVKPCLECSVCGEIIPSFAISDYIKYGNCHIPV